MTKEQITQIGEITQNSNLSDVKINIYLLEDLFVNLQNIELISETVLEYLEHFREYFKHIKNGYGVDQTSKLIKFIHILTRDSDEGNKTIDTLLKQVEL